MSSFRVGTFPIVRLLTGGTPGALRCMRHRFETGFGNWVETGLADPERSVFDAGESSHYFLMGLETAPMDRDRDIVGLGVLLQTGLVEEQGGLQLLSGPGYDFSRDFARGWDRSGRT